jgi:hypothetical protein
MVHLNLIDKKVKNFIHLPSSVEAFEPEEIGVEALLR